MTGTIRIGFGADNNAAMAVGAVIASIGLSSDAGTRVEVYVADCGISKGNLRRLLRTAGRHGIELRILTLDSHAKNLLRKLSVASNRSYPPAIYSRLLLPSLLPESVEKLVYLDSDMIVCRDLRELWANHPSDGNLLSAVADLPHDNGNARRLVPAARRSNVDYDPRQAYFQSGLLVLDVVAFRRESIIEKVLLCLDDNPDFTFPDQDALNVLLSSRTERIDPRWNQMSAVFWYGSYADSPFTEVLFESLKSSPFIVHYSGRPKPWERSCAHPLVHRWFEALDATEWSGWRPTAVNQAIARLPRARRQIARKLRRLL